MTCCLQSFAQVGISKDMSFRPDVRTQLHVKQDNEAVRLPRVNTFAALPASGTGTTTNGTQGSVIFNKETGSIVQNDGTQWKISDGIVSTMKNGKMARFVRNTVGTLNFGDCGSIFTGNTCSGDKVVSPISYVFNNTGLNTYNDIPTDVTMSTSPNSMIRFNTMGLYRISFKSGQASVSLPRVCLGVESNFYTRAELQKSTNGSTWASVASNTSNQKIPGAAQAGDILGIIGQLANYNTSGYANAITYTGVFNPGEFIRVQYSGNLNMGLAVCSTSIALLGDGGNMKINFDGTGSNDTEVIVEKINF